MAKESTVAGKGQGPRKLRAGSVEHSRDLGAWGYSSFSEHRQFSTYVSLWVRKFVAR